MVLEIFTNTSVILVVILFNVNLDALSQQDSFEELLEKMEYEIKNPEDPFAEKNAKFEEYYKSGFFKF